jgi:hypothetical protein
MNLAFYANISSKLNSGQACPEFNLQQPVMHGWGFDEFQSGNFSHGRSHILELSGMRQKDYRHGLTVGFLFLHHLGDADVMFTHDSGQN